VEKIFKIKCFCLDGEPPAVVVMHCDRSGTAVEVAGKAADRTASPSLPIKGELIGRGSGPGMNGFNQ
jgi:hypothetical protein